MSEALFFKASSIIKLTILIIGGVPLSSADSPISNSSLAMLTTSRPASSVFLITSDSGLSSVSYNLSIASNISVSVLITGSILNFVSIFRSSIANILSGSAMATISVFENLHMAITLYCLAINSGISLTLSLSALYFERLIAGIFNSLLITDIRSFSPIIPSLTSILLRLPPSLT